MARGVFFDDVEECLLADDHTVLAVDDVRGNAPTLILASVDGAVPSEYLCLFTDVAARVPNGVGDLRDRESLVRVVPKELFDCVLCCRTA